MALTKKQKLYGSVLTTAVLAFGWDYLSTGDKPAPAAADLLIHGTAAPQLGGGATPATTASDPLPRSAIATRLQRVAASEKLDPENVNSAFALGPGWLPEKPSTAAVAGKNDAPAVVEPAKDFARRHRLDAVMVRPHGGYAIVDGIGVFVGQQCERFRLASVTQNSAIFVWNSERVELKIARPGELIIDGSVISNRTGLPGGEAAVDGRPVTQP